MRIKDNDISHEKIQITFEKWYYFKFSFELLHMSSKLVETNCKICI